MKKLFSCITIVIFSVVFLSSCITVRNKFELSKSREQIVSIDIYNIEGVYTERNVDYLLEENTPIYTIPQVKIEEFLNTLCSFEYKKEVVLFPIPMDGGCDLMGYVIAIIYDDGAYDLVSYSGIFRYSIGKKGQGQYRYDYSDYSGQIDWNEFIVSYVKEA